MVIAVKNRSVAATVLENCSVCGELTCFSRLPSLLDVPLPQQICFDMLGRYINYIKYAAEYIDYAGRQREETPRIVEEEQDLG
jgi:hypothetical protein